jgi:hypothetical protein
MLHDGMTFNRDHVMLKEVGASGQISLGKKYAGQLFDLQTQEDGSIVMRPVKVVPLTTSVQEEPARYDTRNASTAQWAQQHAGRSRSTTWAAARALFAAHAGAAKAFSRGAIRHLPQP